MGAVKAVPLATGVGGTVEAVPLAINLGVGGWGEAVEVGPLPISWGGVGGTTA